jgi:CheY-like chemotaxis protein
MVLVVTDQPSVLDTARQMLDRRGALVRTAHTTEAALRATAIHRPHLILIDVDLPNMDGFDLARRLRRDAEFGRTRLVALTSRPELPAAMRGWSLEFDGHMSKPVTQQAVAALARHVAGGRASLARGKESSGH